MLFHFYGYIINSTIVTLAQKLRNSNFSGETKNIFIVFPNGEYFTSFLGRQFHDVSIVERNVRSLIFINDLPDCVQSSTRLFADDCILYRQIKTQRDCGQLQEVLDSLARWEEKWGMTIYPDKCSTLRVTRPMIPVESHYSLKGHVLETCDTTRYLGVELQSNLSWNQQMDQVLKKGNSIVGFLRYREI